MNQKKFHNNPIFIISFLFLLSSCGGNKNENFEIDVSNIKKPLKDLNTKETNNPKEEILSINYELKPLKKKGEILTGVKFGRKDPFALSSDSSITLSKLKLKGFITISGENYAMVSYLDNEGPVSTESIGGVNTNLLPEGALISEIKANDGYIKISHQSELFIIFLKKNDT